MHYRNTSSVSASQQDHVQPMALKPCIAQAKVLWHTVRFQNDKGTQISSVYSVEWSDWLTHCHRRERNMQLMLQADLLNLYQLIQM